MKKIIAFAASAAVAVAIQVPAAYAEDYGPPASDHSVCQELPYGTPDNPCGFESRNTWVLQRGQTLWRVAVIVYGNGRRWRDIAAANGIRNHRRVRAGTVLVMP